MQIATLILAPSCADDRVLVGVSLSERARRSARLAGIDATHIHVVRDRADIAAARARIDGPLLVVRAHDRVVMPALLRLLDPARPGSRAAVTAAGSYAGAMRLEAADASRLWDALAADADGDRAVASALDGVTVDGTTHHLARDDADARAATAWLWQFVHKPGHDVPLTRYVWRTLSRPVTRIFVRLPFTPNMITILSIVAGQLGCILAARAGAGMHILGLGLVVWVNGVLDAVDGEVARLRLESSRTGDWLDALGDHLLRITLILALGSHVASQLPALPVWPVALGAVVATLLAMAPMYWYCLTVLRSPNLQHYGDVVRGKGATTWVSRVGVQLASRDVTDLAVFALGVLGLSVVSLAGFALGGGVALVTILRSKPWPGT